MDRSDIPHVSVLERAKQGDTTLGSVIRRYIDCFKNVSLWQQSKQSALLFLEKHEIGTVNILAVFGG